MSAPTLDDPIIDIPGLGPTPISQVKFEDLDSEQINSVVNIAQSNHSVFRYFLQQDDSNSENIRTIAKSCRSLVNASSKPTIPMGRAKKGDVPSKSQVMELHRSINKKINSGLKGIFFDRNRKVKPIILTSTNPEFFTKHLGDNVGYEMVYGDVCIAYNTTGRKKNPIIRQHLSKYELDFDIETIRESAIVYSSSRDIPIDEIVKS
jgi:hypothetical protein